MAKGSDFDLHARLSALEAKIDNVERDLRSLLEALQGNGHDGVLVKQARLDERLESIETRMESHDKTRVAVWGALGTAGLAFLGQLAQWLFLK